MKLNRIKSLVPALAFALSMGCMTSCVNDLHVENINPQQTSELDADALLNKIYSSFVLTGQVGPDGDKDIKDIDEGRSDLYRKSWEMNEFPTGEASWQWDDTGLPELLNKTWGADNASSVGLYYRLFFSITLCNSYLDQVTDDGSTDIKQKRAEVRFIRSLLYYYVMDFYANATFIEHVTLKPGTMGIRYTRPEYFNFIESELTDIDADLAAPGQQIRTRRQGGRMDAALTPLPECRGLHRHSPVGKGKGICREGDQQRLLSSEHHRHQQLFCLSDAVPGRQRHQRRTV